MPPPLIRVPPPPSGLSKEARKIWRRLAPILVACGRLTALDLDQLALYCDALVKLQRAAEALECGLLLPGRRDDYRTSPVWKIYRELQATCRALGAEFGLTPGARTRFQTSLEPASSEASDPAVPGYRPGLSPLRRRVRGGVLGAAEARPFARGDPEEVPDYVPQEWTPG